MIAIWALYFLLSLLTLKFKKFLRLDFFSLFSWFWGPKNKNVLYLFQLFNREAAIYLGHNYGREAAASLGKDNCELRPRSGACTFFSFSASKRNSGTWKWVTITIKPNSRRRLLIDASCPKKAPSNNWEAQFRYLEMGHNSRRRLLIDASCPKKKAPGNNWEQQLRAREAAAFFLKAK